MVLPEDEVVLLDVSSVVAEEAVTALDVATEAVVAAGATELEADVELGFCLAGHAATVTADTAISMVWNFILLNKIGAQSGQMKTIGGASAWKPAMSALRNEGKVNESDCQVSSVKERRNT